MRIRKMIVQKASITVEAVFVVPVIIWIVVFVIYQSMVHADKVIIGLTADRVLEEIAVSNEAENVEELNDVVKVKINEMLMMYSVESVSISANKTSCELIIEARLDKITGFSFDRGPYILSQKMNIAGICPLIRGSDIVKD